MANRSETPDYLRSAEAVCDSIEAKLDRLSGDVRDISRRMTSVAASGTSSVGVEGGDLAGDRCRHRRGAVMSRT